MKMLQRVLLVCVAVSVLALPNYGETQTFSIYETPLKIQSDGFPAESHHVTTEDGYILEMHRIPHGRQVADTSSDRPVVFLMHGLLAASNSYILLGPELSFAYNLADAGFDIWMGNARGNKNSRYHVTLDPDDSQEKREFFDFTFEEIGMYDVTAMVDYVLEFTGREKLHYIGHSQGGTAFLVLGSMLPEYNEKFTSVHLLAGVGYMEYFPNEELVTVAAMSDAIYAMASMLGAVELFPPNSTEMIPGFDINFPRSAQCTGNLDTRYICEAVGVRHILRDDDHTASGSVFDDYEPAGASLKQISHYGQNIRDKQFRRYHHGLLSNLFIYGSSSPPAYNLSLITAKVTMHYSVNDHMLDERDVLAMANDMPNTVVRKVARETFLHEDFVAAEDAKELVTDFIIEAIKEESGWSRPQLQEVDYNIGDYNIGDEVMTVDDNPITESPLPLPAINIYLPATDSASTIISTLYLVTSTLLVLLK